MAAANLLALIDDIAVLLDDVAVLSKVAVKKTAGVLGDDLALNAEQVSGVKPDRELPVVWAVAKGSMLNKAILVPAALAISAFLPILIPILLVVGGLYLCFEGFEKIWHKRSSEARQAEREARLQGLADPSVDLVVLEKQKIKGAIRTDFILSAEIIVIVLGTVKAADFTTQVTVLSALAVAITIGVYGLVAAIVKLDDAGLYLLRQSVKGNWRTAKRTMGRTLLWVAPGLMKTLSVVGTVAMFLVGGGILVHSIPFVHHALGAVQATMPVPDASVVTTTIAIISEGLVGLLAGGLVLALVTLFKSLRPSRIA